MRLEFLFGSGLNISQFCRHISLPEYFHIIKFVLVEACSDIVSVSHYLLLSGAARIVQIRN